MSILVDDATSVTDIPTVHDVVCSILTVISGLDGYLNTTSLNSIFPCISDGVIPSDELLSIEGSCRKYVCITNKLFSHGTVC